MLSTVYDKHNIILKNGVLLIENNKITFGDYKILDIPESVNASKNIMGTGVSLSKYPNSHLQRDEMHS